MHVTFKLLFILLCGVFLAACTGMSLGSSTNNHPDPKPAEEGDGYMLKPDVKNINEHLEYEGRDLKKIYFAGGCFWGVEAYMNRIYGVSQVVSGYANGKGKNPSYEDVIKGDQNFAETVEVTYDPERVSLDTLIDRLFQVIDPTSKNKQGNDVGVQYRTGIYFTDPAEEKVVKSAIEREQEYYKDTIVTEAQPLENFYKAEEFHQDYLEKNPNGYCHINLNTANQFAIDPIEMDKEIVEKLSK
ncbi:peptide-methionine (S)-S-oxide reductase MsrA [Virgibacillus halodenitrificans]|jgi:methionine-S-sulfoxide reductase|uniref:Peptide methionine sulfoxide reductase MsrA n=2 Tax=Virgibacillus halodenitrificans TaxID=1482 RepID=A0ABR7VMA5_VIRHA|nr:peptide-methionine (S)-S-oxide reductase MsrA [Virgibacillus halodenitrificans]MBD1221972.1 peptide-methionine (S)-S-oxide reductase MsrA [Virgibacillus halodenitrificans]MCG1028479.1 peptide-methionine (S)-S-oxide reductase MsrA [Virgibacillus halodenitrificans]